MASKKIAPAKRIAGLERNLWVEFTDLAVSTGAINLGVGMPDFGPPSYLIDALIEAVQNPMNNQYTRSQGHPRLVKALAHLYGQLMKRKIDPMKEVLVSVGASSCLSYAITAFLQEGDEIILIEPFFDCYHPLAQMAGAKSVFVPLRPQGHYPGLSKDWVLDPGELESAFSPHTKMIVINNPNNPIGKVYTQKELEVMAELCKRYDVICLMDEVYEWLIYSGCQHIRLASFPDMWQRTITVGSGGKTFSATGWKIGWAIGPDHLLKHMQTVHANTNYNFPTALQEAVAQSLELEITRLDQPECYFRELSHIMEKNRDKMAEVLREIGMEPILPDGGYFMLADTAPLGLEFDTEEEPYDFCFVKWMMKEKGVATIPPTAFFSPQHAHLAEKFIRLCFVKKESTLQASYQKLQEWAAELNVKQ